MTNANDPIPELDIACSAISVEAVETLDFDSLATLLKNIKEVLGDLNNIRVERNRLREDLISRIAGMVKANLACRHSDDDADLAVRLADSPEEFSAEELIKLYGRTAARFRDNFPASFKYLIPSRTYPGRPEDWQDFKI